MVDAHIMPAGYVSGGQIEMLGSSPPIAQRHWSWTGGAAVCLKIK
jgi:hypothetical protein